MATYTPVSRSIPSAQRSCIITNVAATDRIDITDVLGRPARRLQFIMTDAADVIDYRINNLRKHLTPRSREDAFSDLDQAFGVFGAQEISVWLDGGSVPTYNNTGAIIIETAEGLDISSVEIDALTLSTGSVISIVVW